jgi:hypothetical protein
MPKSEWSHAGRGFKLQGGATYCCEGCAEGTGCTCEQRLRPEHDRENKETYIRKMKQQVREWESRYLELQAVADARGAQSNAAVHAQMDEIRKEINATRTKIESLESGSQEWPEAALDVSGTYKEMKGNVRSASSRIKNK